MKIAFIKRGKSRLARVFLSAVVACACLGVNAEIPLPEHPRPDFKRDQWLNLNGPWGFAFDKKDAGLEDNWQAKTEVFRKRIIVPFPWGSELSGVKDEADIGWYAKIITVPENWKGKRVFVVIGASDWRTTGWLDGRELGAFRGGYTPFEFELTPHVKWGNKQQLVFRVDDTPHPFKLEGKQGYGPARGIWQTVYLEARPRVAFDTIHFSPDITAGKVKVEAAFDKPLPDGARMRLTFKTGEFGKPVFVKKLESGGNKAVFDVEIPNPHLWSLDDPFLYEVTAELTGENIQTDRVDTYFGMREIGIVNLPDSGHPYIALNGKPVYLQTALDQAYHPKGFYTYPSDEFMKNEILRTRRLGLNGQRIHVKIDVPRKLYWADKLGVLIMADVPNSWGEPNAEMRKETETALRGMIERDFNHPSIFSWVIFNETWGLRTGDKGYTPETQNWVASMYRLAKRLDPTRLVEDNSPCNHDHVETDINTWHRYLPGYAWEKHLNEVTENTFPGSGWNYIGDYKQGDQPLMNSECGDVWGYEGSTGDVDWSWDYHLMMNAFRKHPKICGWLYTEHHDVINEWNGYYNYDRSPKFTGLGELVDGMSMRDLHAENYIVVGDALCTEVEPGEPVEVPLGASFMSDGIPGAELVLHAELNGWDQLGRKRSFSRPMTRELTFEPWSFKELNPLEITMPKEPALAILSVTLEDRAGSVLQRNFTTFLVSNGTSPRKQVVESEAGKTMILRTSPGDFSNADWSLRQWNILEGLKANGAGYGYFEYRIPWPEDVEPDDIQQASFIAEVSSKRLLGKDIEDAGRLEGDFMRGRGTHDPGLNPNSYPMTDEDKYPGAVRVSISSEALEVLDLEDDPADHRGILSWFSQKRDGRLREAGSYGYRVNTQIPKSVINKAHTRGEIVIRLEADQALPRGLAVYGERFGRYPIDPSIVLLLK
ncbi:MAG: glycoside hydrolase family 2 [Verrucomicrobia bacterium]|nr:glycoside hydrolase family 2 [Verrucomicrobiota bacterium]MCF7708959.1 glycoside hydrolase family 2 [Verrucomicrobiota bacterium]